MTRSLRKALPATLLVVSLGCSSNTTEHDQTVNLTSDSLEVFSYDLFRKASVHFSEIDLNKCPTHTAKDSRVDSLEAIDLPTNPASAFVRPLQNGAYTGSNSIRVGKSTYDIDSLMVSCSRLTGGQVANTIASVSTLTFGRSSYIAFFLQDLSNPVTDPNTLLLLFDVTDQQRVHCILGGLQASVDPRCLGDFDHDGVLDLAFWTQGYAFSDTLYMASLTSRSFQPRRDLAMARMTWDVKGYHIDRTNCDWIPR